MKKTRLLTSALSLALAGAICVGFTACGDGPYKSKAYKMKSEEVTATEWVAAFKEDTFKNVKVEDTSIYDGEYEKKDGTWEDAKITIKTTITVAEEVSYYKVEATVNKGGQAIKDEYAKQSAEVYSTKGTDGKYTVVYKNDDGKWAEKTEEYDAAASMLARYLRYGAYQKLFKFDGADFGYMADIGAEGLTDEESALAWDLRNIRLKFKDGQFAAIFAEQFVTRSSEAVDNGDGSVSTSSTDVARIFQMTTFTYGGQKLTVPKAG